MAYTPPPYNNIEFRLYQGYQSPPLEQVYLVVGPTLSTGFTINQVEVAGQAVAAEVVFGHFTHPQFSLNGGATHILPTREGEGDFQVSMPSLRAIANGLEIQEWNNGAPWVDQYPFNSYTHIGNIYWSSNMSLEAITGSWDHMSAVLKDKIYMFGGLTSSPSGGAKTTIRSVDLDSNGVLADDVWTQRADTILGARSRAGIFITGDKVHLIGGYDYIYGAIYISTCVCATVDEDGDFGTWSYESELPIGISSPGILVTERRVYVLGGKGGASGAIGDWVYSAPLDPSGEIGTWELSENALPFAIQGGACFKIGNKAYYVGGERTSDNFTGFLWADIDEDGVIGEWEIHPTLQLQYAQPWVDHVLCHDYLYLFTSETGGTWTYSIPITNGSLGSITAGSYGYTWLGDHGPDPVVVTKGRIYRWGTQTAQYVELSGGFNDYADLSYSPAWIVLEPIDGDGDFSIPMVVVDSNALDPRYGTGDADLALISVSGTAQTGDHTWEYINGSPWNLQHPFNESTGTITNNWVADDDLIGTMAYAAMAVLAGSLFIFGGVLGGSATNSVMRVAIDTDGTLSTGWDFLTSLPGPRYAAALIETKNRLYLIGGAADMSGPLTSCITTTISSTGVLGTWTTGPTLPGTGLMNSSVIVTRNRVYLIGGKEGATEAPSTVVYTAPIDNDGILGSWTTHSYPLPVARKDTVVFKTNGYVYLVGGIDSSLTPAATVYRAAFGEDGVLGPWSAQADLPGSKCECCVFTTLNNVFIIGDGYNVYAAAINSDGTLGTWETIFCAGLYDATNQHLVVTNGKILLLGGWDRDTSYYLPFSGGFNDYRSLGYHLLWDAPTEPITGDGAYAIPQVSAHGLYVTNLVLNGNLALPKVRFEFKSGVFYPYSFVTPLPVMAGIASSTSLGAGHVRLPKVGITAATAVQGSYTVPIFGLWGSAEADILSNGQWGSPVIRVQSLANMNPWDNPIHGVGSVHIHLVRAHGEGAVVAPIVGDFVIRVPSMHAMAAQGITAMGLLLSPLVRVASRSSYLVNDPLLVFEYGAATPTSDSPDAPEDEILIFDCDWKTALPPTAPPPASGQDPIMQFER